MKGNLMCKNVVLDLVIKYRNCIGKGDDNLCKEKLRNIAKKKHGKIIKMDAMATESPYCTDLKKMIDLR